MKFVYDTATREGVDINRDAASGERIINVTPRQFIYGLDHRFYTVSGGGYLVPRSAGAVADILQADQDASDAQAATDQNIKDEFDSAKFPSLDQADTYIENQVASITNLPKAKVALEKIFKRQNRLFMRIIKELQ